METISSIHKKYQSLSSHPQFQPHNLQNQPQSLNYSTSILNPKTQFLKYASSLIQITTQQDIPNQLQIYEQSQLINPPDSLILKYQNLKKHHQNQSTSHKSPNKSIENLIIQGILNLIKFFENHSKKLTPNKIVNTSQTLIDMSAFSSVQNFTQKNQKILLEQAFHQLKSSYFKFKINLKISRPLLPIDKKKHVSESKKQFIKTSIVIVDQNKRQGVEQISGILTFKVLEIFSDSFRILKWSVQNQITLNFYKKLNCASIKIPFYKIKSYDKGLNLSKYDSKILTLSRSKSKGSLSKLKIRNLNSNSQKKMSVKRLNSCKNTDYSTSGQQNFNQRFISSEILEDFDFTQLQSNVNDDEYEIETQKKMQFNNRLKKKSIKQSQSQAETLNSLRSLQSQQYQFGNGIQSAKVSSSLKPFSTKNANSTEDIPTTKNISYDVKKKKTSFQTKFFNPSLNHAKQIRLFNNKQRRYLNVRTNLFELPLQLNLRRQSNKEQMQKYYHLMPQNIVGNMVQEKDNFSTNIKSLNLTQYFKVKQKRNDLEGQNDLFKKQEKEKTGQDFEYKRLQNFNYQLRNVHSQKNIPITVSILELNTQRNNKLFKRNNSPSQNQLNMNFVQVRKDQIKKINKEQKIKNKKMTKNNLEQYYFKAQLQKIQTSNKNSFIPQKKLKNQRLITRKTQNSQIDNVSGNKQFFQTEYRTSKLLSQGNAKIIKSLSPKVKVSLHSPYRTGKFGSRNLSKNLHNQTYSGRSDVSSKMSLQKCVKNQSNLISLQIQSSVNTPRNIHQYVPNIQQNFISTHRSNSKLKVFSQTARSLSPQQNKIIPYFFPNQNTQRKISFVTTLVHNTADQNIIRRPPSNTVQFVQQNSTLVPTISNLSNQSKFQNLNPNVHQVINYGPNSGFNQQLINRTSSILSTQSHQSKQKIIIGKLSQVLMSPTQRAMYDSQNCQITNKNINFEDKRNQDFRLQSNINKKRGLNVMTINNLLMQPKNSSNQLNSFRQKSISNQKLFITPRK